MMAATASLVVRGLTPGSFALTPTAAAGRSKASAAASGGAGGDGRGGGGGAGLGSLGVNHTALRCTPDGRRKRGDRDAAVVRAGKSDDQGRMEKKRCDLCLGTGLRKCYGCHVSEGWRAQNFSTSKCERAVWSLFFSPESLKSTLCSRGFHHFKCAVLQTSHICARGCSVTVCVDDAKVAES